MDDFDKFWANRGDKWSGKLDIKQFSREIWEASEKKSARKLKQKQKLINQYESGSMKSLCNATAVNKKKFKIALRRKYPQFESTSQFVKYCIKQVTGMSFKEFCEMGE